MNEKLINTAVAFLKNPKVKDASREKQIEFLTKKGLKEDEIAEAYKRVEVSVEKTNKDINSTVLPQSVQESYSKTVL